MGHLFIDILRNSVLITGLVVIMMMMIESLNIESKGLVFKGLRRTKFGQVIVAVFLGSVPGCMGGFAAVSLYTHRMFSFGALVAMMIASSGDEAFVMLAMIPEKALIIFAVLFVIAVAVGVIVDRIGDRISAEVRSENPLTEAVNAIMAESGKAFDPALCQVFEACRQKIQGIYTHSNSRKVRNHPRNLTDTQFSYLIQSGGLCGLSLCTDHLSEGEASSDDVLRHLDHFLALGGENHVAIGTDFDGIDTPPADIRRNRDLFTLANKMARIGYSDCLIKKIFWNNANDFFGKYEGQDTV